MSPGGKDSKIAALLRGVNLARRRRLAMADVRKALTEAGYEDVVTHGQSGNVVLRPRAGGAARTAADLEKVLGELMGAEVAVVVRTRKQIEAVLAADPLGDVADDPSRYQVTFLGGKPDTGWFDTLDPAEFAPERFALVGRELYLWCPNGLQRSAVASLPWEKLGVVGTSRNWRTVAKLGELLRE